MKKRKGASIPKALRQQSASYSTPTVVRRAREFPVVECWISADWKEDAPGLVEIIVARQQPDNMICFGVYLVDKLCLGLKNTFARANYTPERYQREAQHIFRDRKSQTCSPELAYQMIYEAIDYAAKFGFAPQKDFELTQYMLAPRGEYHASYKLKFGQKNGKPLYISGPHDNVPAILAQLEKTAGKGNYDVLIMGPPDLY
ncbi:MAG: hypothetical protein JOZ18_11375 [Chloroflexi bacterium]|nr:hypothetical protein [Chloroflexota bacterium]